MGSLLCAGYQAYQDPYSLASSAGCGMASALWAAGRRMALCPSSQGAPTGSRDEERP